ncbi:hypothetical protein B0H11DRAFT_2241487 [Mycena galericulata]|nr:hypothetical protein B0H11DRAFT_2241487 [Mycena galericulata]
MPKRNRDYSPYSSSESDSDEYVVPSQRPKGKNKSNPKVKGPSTKAEVTIRATDTPLDKSDSQKRLDKIDSAVVGRIKKALALASHAQTGEDEARAALRMASKLLERHNGYYVPGNGIRTAETCWDIDRVRQEHRGQKHRCQYRRLDEFVVCRDENFFDCQSYTTKFNGALPKVDWAFYGLAEQTVTAAHAFEMTYNLILAWSLKSDIGKGLHAKNCYRTGVARGLYEMAKKEKKQDQERAERKERALLRARQDEEASEDRSRVERLKGPEGGVEPEVKIKTEETKIDVKPEPDRRVKIEEVDDDDDFGGQPAFEYPEDTDGIEAGSFHDVKPDFNDEDNVDDLLDLDAEKPKLKRPPSVGPSFGSMDPPASVVPLAEQKVKDEPEDDSPWSSVGQLVAFRATSIAIGDEYLKTQGVKLRKSRKRKALEFKDSDAHKIYKRGKQDAKKIDVRQRRLRDVEMD